MNTVQAMEGMEKVVMDEPRVLRCCVSTRVAPLRHQAVSRMDSAERLIVTGIVGGLHRPDDIGAHCGDPLC